MDYEEDEGGEEFAGTGAAVPDSSESVPTKRKRYFKRTPAAVSFIRSKSAFSFGTSSTLAERTPSAKLQAATADAVEELTASGVPCKASSAYLLLQLREQEQERPFLSRHGISQPSAIMSAPVLTQQHMFNPAAAAPAYSSNMSYAGSSELHHQYQTEAAHEQQTGS
eukprot:16786-Heterococcus_DN1.PRE.1